MEWLVLAVLFLGIPALWAKLKDWFGPEPEAPEEPPIDRARNGVFEVIETSLRVEPEKWTALDLDDKVVYWLVNDETKVAVWVPSGPERLYLANGFQWPQSLPEQRERVYPPAKWQLKIYEAAAPLIAAHFEKIELARLDGLLKGFERRTMQ